MPTKFVFKMPEHELTTDDELPAHSNDRIAGLIAELNLLWRDEEQLKDKVYQLLDRIDQMVSVGQGFTNDLLFGLAHDQGLIDQDLDQAILKARSAPKKYKEVIKQRNAWLLTTLIEYLEVEYDHVLVGIKKKGHSVRWPRVYFTMVQAFSELATEESQLSREEIRLVNDINTKLKELVGLRRRLRETRNKSDSARQLLAESKTKIEAMWQEWKPTDAVGTKRAIDDKYEQIVV